VKVTVVAFDNCMTSAVFGLLDAFGVASRSASDPSPWLRHEIRLATPTGRPVRGFGGHRIEPNCALADATDSDVVVLPAILGDLVATLERERLLIDWLAAFRRRKTLLASACTGAFFLAEARALDGKRITTNPYYSALFRERYPRVELALDQRIAVDRNVICAGSTTAVLDLAIHLIDRLAGHEVAVTTAKLLSMSKNPESQRPYLLFVAPRDHGDERVLALQDWIEANHATAIGLAAMARAAHMSLRNASRRFQSATGMSPMRYLRVIRLETAKRLLEGRAMPIGRLAAQVGYQDARAFARAFQMEVGVSPAQYRQRFRSTALAGR
jgi:transcriptional regulator GlxA family with amidase domain